MPTALNYDDGAASFVGITLLALYTLPAAVHIARTVATFSPDGAGAARAPAAARTPAEAAKLARLAAGKGRRVLWTPGFTLYAVVTGLAAAALAALAAYAASRSGSLAGYDPHAILGLDADASEREIKSAYRKLSMLHHPDKGGDAQMFQKIAKAYEALSDPVARENLAKFGNPDGKQTLEVAIGIPSALVGERGRFGFMAAYLLVLILGIPAAMRYFWRRNQATKHVGDFDLHVASNEWLVLVLRERPELAPKAVPELLAGMREVDRAAYEAAGFNADDQREIKALYDDLVGSVGGGRMARLSAWARAVIEPQLIANNNVLLHAQLNRRELKSPRLRALLDANLKAAPRALEFMFAVAFQFTLQAQTARDAALAAGNRAAAGEVRSYVEALGTIPLASAQLVQGLYGRDSCLLQAFPPPLAAAVADALAAKLPARVRSPALATLADLARLPEAERAALLAGVPGVDGPARAAELAREVGEFPLLDVTAEYKVKDEEDEDSLAEGDVVTATITVRHANLLARPGATPETRVPPALVPRFPFNRPESWVVYLLDVATGRLVAGTGGAWEPAKAVESVTLNFLAPRPGKLTLEAHVASMCYVGCNAVVTTVLDVAPRPMPAPVGAAEGEDGDDAGAPDKTIEAFFAGADDESDVSEEEKADRADEEEEEEGEGGGGGARARARAGAGAGAGARKPAAGAAGKAKAGGGKAEGGGKGGAAPKRAGAGGDSGGDNADEDGVPLIVPSGGGATRRVKGPAAPAAAAAPAAPAAPTTPADDAGLKTE